MAGNLVARAIVEGDETWRKFTPFELVWAGGVFGRTAAQLRVWIKRLTDTSAERRAQVRYAARRSEAGPEAQSADPGTAASESIVPPDDRVDEAEPAALPDPGPPHEASHQHGGD
jgi:gamma-glutamylputrescine oxidase